MWVPGLMLGNACENFTHHIFVYPGVTSGLKLIPSCPGVIVDLPGPVFECLSDA